jgi:hypothetical protein
LHGPLLWLCLRFVIQKENARFLTNLTFCTKLAFVEKIAKIGPFGCAPRLDDKGGEVNCRRPDFLQKVSKWFELTTCAGLSFLAGGSESFIDSRGRYITILSL